MCQFWSALGGERKKAPLSLLLLLQEIIIQTLRTIILAGSIKMLYRNLLVQIKGILSI